MQKHVIVIAILTIIWCTICSAFRMDEHHNYEAMVNVLKDVNKRCPDRTRLYTLPPVGIAEFDTSVYPLNVTGRTVQGRELWVIEFAMNPGRHTVGIPEFKYVANMHGNEVTGREHLLKLIDYMCEAITAPGNDATDDVLWLLQNTRMHFMPSMNPDGYELAASLPRDSKGQKDWLKGRANGNNVDLNRNFPDLDRLMYKLEKSPHHANNHLIRLKQTLIEYGDKLENEVKMVMVWLQAIPFALSANFHNGDLVANYPYDEAKGNEEHSYTPSPDDKTFFELALSYSKPHHWMAVDHEPCDKMGKDNFVEQEGTTNGAEWYSVPGGMQDYNYLQTNCMEITLEVGCDKFPEAKELPQLWEDNIDSLFNFMFQSHIGIKGLIIPPGDEPVIANISVIDLDPLDSVESVEGKPAGYIDHDILSTPYGDYFRLLADGNYQVTAGIEIKDNDGNDVLVTRTICVRVSNNPRAHQEAQIVDFDFRDLSKQHETYGCEFDMEPIVKDQDRSYSYSGYNGYDTRRMDDYDDVVALLQQLYGKYKKNNYY